MNHLLALLTPEDQKLGQQVLDRALKTAMDGWDGKSAHPPGVDPGDQAELLASIFGYKALGLPDPAAG